MKKQRKKNHSPTSLFLYITTSIVILLLTVFNLLSMNRKTHTIEVKTQANTFAQQSYWKEFLTQNPTYTPGWIELAEIEVKLRNHKEADIYFVHAQKLDPNNVVLR